MTPQEAKTVLLLYRPGDAGAADPREAEALRMSRLDAELGGWLEQHCAFQTAMRAKLREIEPPANLKAALLTQRRIIRPAIWRRGPAWLAAAAAFALLATLAALWLPRRAPDTFADFQSRVVRYALREYALDVRTSDMRAVRDYMVSKGAPGDYLLPPGLGRQPLAGGGFLRWRNQPVAMVCFQRDDHTMLYLFVINRQGLKAPPPSNPVSAQVSRLLTVSWSDPRRTYVLAGPEEPGFQRKYLGDPQ